MSQLPNVTVAAERRSAQRLAFVMGWLFLLGALALVVIQPRSAVDLRFHWIGGPAIVAAGCYLALRASVRFSAGLFGAWLVLFGLVCLVVTWQSGLTTGSQIAGLLPYSDAFGYLSDAQRLLVGDPISSFSSRRPMFTAFLAGILHVVGNDLKWALATMTVLVSSAIAFASLTLRRNQAGFAMTCAFAVVTWIFYRRYVGTTLTEHLGLGLGLIGFGLLWRGSQIASRKHALVGIFVLTLALNARAGTFFVLPVLALWSGFFFAAPGRRFCWTTFFLFVSAILAAFIANRLLLQALGGAGAAAFSNFSYTLYGLVKGGDWTLALREHPDLARLLPDAQAQAVYRLALDHIWTNPLSLATGAVRAWLYFLVSCYGFAAAYHPYSAGFLGSYILTAAAAVGLVQLWRGRKIPEAGMALAAIAGIVLSVPFVPPWDADSMRAYAATLPFIALLPAWGIGHLLGGQPSAPELDTPSSPLVLHGVLLSGIVVLCFLLPLAVRGSAEPLSMLSNENVCRQNAADANVNVIPGTYVTLSKGDAGMDTAIKSLLFNSPGRAADRVVESMLTPQLPIVRLRRNAATGHAPESAMKFVESIQAGQAVAMARVRYAQSGTEVVVPVHFLSPPTSLPESPFRACVESTHGLIGEARIP